MDLNMHMDKIAYGQKCTDVSKKQKKNQNQLTRCKEKKNCAFAEWSKKFLRSDKLNFCISFGNEGSRV